MPGLDENPLTQNESIAGGCSLIFVSIICLVTRLLNLDVFDYELSSINTTSELTAFHDTVENNRLLLLITSALLWCTLPFVLTHIHSIKRIFETLLNFEDYHCWKWIYIVSWLMVSVVMCALASVVLVLTCYYGIFIVFLFFE